jgi:hypothetical protein
MDKSDFDMTGPRSQAAEDNQHRSDDHMEVQLGALEAPDRCNTPPMYLQSLEL